MQEAKGMRVLLNCGGRFGFDQQTSRSTDAAGIGSLNTEGEPLDSVRLTMMRRLDCKACLLGPEFMCWALVRCSLSFGAAYLIDVARNFLKRQIV